MEANNPTGSTYKFLEGKKQRLMDTQGGRGSGTNWEIGIDIYTLLCMK